jgi:hypothetical protein
MHKSYEELCALAATGQITGDAMQVLDQHVKGCRRCRVFLEDLVSLKAHVTPVVAGCRTRSWPPPDGIRERFLQRAASAGLELHPGPPVEVSARLEMPARSEQAGFSESLCAVRNRMQDWYEAVPSFAVPVTVGLLCGTLGFLVAQHRVASAPRQAAVAPATQAPPALDKLASAQLANLRQENTETRSRLVTLSAEFARMQADKRQAEQELARLAQRATAGDKFEERFREVSAQLQDVDARASRLQTDLEAERSRSATADAVSSAQQKATEEANSKIADLQARLDREPELESGKSMAGDLISARNLHIVDVYDTESNGERKHAFGRVFFVEGKSLVFYAYDLPGPKRANKKVEFQVWGEQAGLSSVSVNLGTMRSDDSGQSRWVLTCDDPKVLSRINAVFITADPNVRPDSQPRGSKMMYAFLGSPNHP